MREWIACAASALLLACGAKGKTSAPTLGDCTDPACAPPIGGGGIRGGAGGGDASPGSGSDAAVLVDAGSVTVTFTVFTTEMNFQAGLAKYGNPVVVGALDPDGIFVTTSDTGVVSPGTLPGVAAGSNWFAVQNVAGAASVLMPTLEHVTVDPAAPQVQLQAILRESLTSILVDTVGWTPPDGTATVILIFVQNGKPLSGVTVTSNPGAVPVAYDVDEVSYMTAVVNPGAATGMLRGTAIVREVPITQSFPVLSPVALEFTVGSFKQTLDAKVARNFVTYGIVSVP